MDTTEREQFERWARLHVGNTTPNLSGKYVAHGFWMYDDDLIETHWMCWKAAVPSVGMKVPPMTDPQKEALYTALLELLVAVRYADPPKNFGTAEEPNMCHEARVPVDFVINAERAIAACETQS